MAPIDTRWPGKTVSKQTDTTDELMAINSDDSGKSSAPQAGWALLYGAWAIALAASLGALFIGEVLGQEPCNLCWYQRIAMFPLALILGLACLYNDFSIRIALSMSNRRLIFALVCCVSIFRSIP